MGCVRWLGAWIRGDVIDTTREFYDLLGVELFVLTVLGMVYVSIGILKLRDRFRRSKSKQEITSLSNENRMARREIGRKFARESWQVAKNENDPMKTTRRIVEP